MKDDNTVFEVLVMNLFFPGSVSFKTSNFPHIMGCSLVMGHPL